MCLNGKGEAPLPNSKDADYPIENIKFCQGKHNATIENIDRFVMCVSPDWASRHSFMPYLDFFGLLVKRRRITKF